MPNASLHLVDTSADSPSRKSKDNRGKKTARSRTKPLKRPSLAKDVMNFPAICCRSSDTLNTAAQLMWNNNVGAIVVVNEKHEPTSVVTDRDIAMASYTQGVPLFDARVESAMSKTIVSCALDTPVEELRSRMSGEKLRRIPVTDSKGQLAGIIGVADLVREATRPLRKECKRGSSSSELHKLSSALYAPEERG